MSAEAALSDADLTGRAAFTFARDADGVTYLSHQFASYPFHVTRPFYLDPDMPGMATLYLQSASGGLFQGDRLHLSAHFADGAAGHLTTQAATKVHGMERGAASQTVEIHAGAGSFAEYLADPLILFPTSRLVSRTHVTVAEDATVILADSFLVHDPGGAGAPFGWFDSETVFARPDGRVLAVDRYRIDGETVAAGPPGITGGLAVQGNLFVISNRVPADELAGVLRDTLKAERAGLYAGASTLPGDCGAWLRVLGDDASVLRAVLDRAWTAARERITGHGPGPRRK